MRKRREHLAGLPLFEQLPREEHSGAVATRRLVHVRRRKQDRHSAREELVKELPELTSAYRIDAVRRLVEQEHLRLVKECARQSELLVHPPGEGLRAPALEFGQAGEGEQSIPTF